MPDFPEHYFLATGTTDVARLRLLQQIYGPGSEAMFRRIGLRDGMRVVEVGCGSGNTACWLAGQVGPSGSVVGLDNSPEQIEVARRQAAERGLRNVEFRVADVYKPDLPEGSFDLAYCRFVLIHLTHPAEALATMRSLVRPGGTVACEEVDHTVSLCDPPVDGVRRFNELTLALGDRSGENFRLGASLPRLFREKGFARPEVNANFQLVLRGEHKRIMGLTFEEFGTGYVREGLATQAEVDRATAELMAMAADETTLVSLPLIVQVWAQR